MGWEKKGMNHILLRPIIESGGMQEWVTCSTMEKEITTLASDCNPSALYQKSAFKKGTKAKSLRPAAIDHSIASTTANT